MTYVGKKPADIIATAVDTTTGTFSSDLTVDTSTLYVDSANNRVGVGTVSPAVGFHVEESTTGDAVKVARGGNYIIIGGSGSGTQYIKGYEGTVAFGNEFAGNTTFLTGDTERARIDSSGNLLVGKTAIGVSTVGVEARADGIFASTRSGGESIRANRTSSDGAIIQLRKDNTVVGNITTNGGTLEVGSGDVYLQFNGTNDWIKPVDGAGSNKANVDLGTSGARFKDLYLSSGVNIKGSDPKITLEHSNENGTAKIYTTAQSAIVLDADPDDTDNGTPIIFKVDGVEVGRFADSKDLLIGKTVSGGGTAGAELRSNGRVFGTSDGTEPLFLNRLTSNGTIATFRKDGTEVGVIGTGNGSDVFNIEGKDNYLQIGAGDTGVRFYSSLNAIYPVNVASNSNRDNAIDLGISTVRFDDIYATNGSIQTSDQQEKNTITDSDLGIDFINRLSPKSYIFNGKTRTHYGLIAQDVETVLTDIGKTGVDFAGLIKSDISEEQDGSEYRYGLRYTEFVAPLIQAVKDQQAIIEDLQARITALENA